MLSVCFRHDPLTSCAMQCLRNAFGFALDLMLSATRFDSQLGS